MPFIVTDIHDPVVLATTCQRLDLGPPEEGGVSLDDGTAAGWVVSLPGLYAPVVCDTLSGLVAYHARDNVHERYARIMSLIFRYYDVRAQLQQCRGRAGQQEHRLVLVQEVA